MQILCLKPSISLFDRERLQSSVPGRIDTFGGRIYGLERPFRQSASTSRWKEWFSTASLPRVGIMAFSFLIAGFWLLSCSRVAIAGKSAQKSATATSSWASLIAEASQRFGLPAHWIRAVMRAESNGDRGAMSAKGAMGLMQVMPETYAALRLRYQLGADPYEPRNNILAGAAYLREMHDRFGPGGFLAAYNAGPGRYDDYLKRGRPLPEETRNYVAVLAPVIGVPDVPHHSASASGVSQLTISGAAHDSAEHLKASSKSKFTSAILQFDDRQTAQTKTLFAIAHAAFEPTSASAQTIDMTALAPAPNHTLIASSTAPESLRIHTSNASRSSLASSGNVLFAEPSTHQSK
ncbi:lytic transglycosylase domain-containing protein [Methylocapsa sp. D3K7]|uniref:lytic transglycosylase domain-containing protein n=1 Tax=Methylocapsa sp. D3K7 TaxID=3041435 RepID=UPI00244E6AD3|nr:lytic transglycosylase domain-containing protein [Methylocapsa sp. D3K7]WGJ14555.1 lytic transglycosylase domain-containing protein [Methylocapsa sp. D3K7]